MAAGRLSLDLQYRIVDRALVGQNKAVMENFKLGERVEAPNALDLPLDLAIALLTDSEGRITVAVLIQGNVGQPTFDYRHLIREAIGNLIRRVVSAPFRALGLFGGDDEVAASSSRRGAPGSGRRSGRSSTSGARSERARELKLVIRGPFDPERDGEAVRSNGVRRDVAQALGVKLEGREDPGPIAYSDAATQRALEAHGGTGGAEGDGGARARSRRAPAAIPSASIRCWDCSGARAPTASSTRRCTADWSSCIRRRRTAAGARGAPGGVTVEYRRFGGHRAEPPGVRRGAPRPRGGG